MKEANKLLSEQHTAIRKLAGYVEKTGLSLRSCSADLNISSKAVSEISKILDMDRQ